MADISLCKNYFCPLAEKCERFTGTPNSYRQSYSNFEPDDEGNCEYFISNETFKTEDYESETDF